MSFKFSEINHVVVVAVVWGEVLIAKSAPPTDRLLRDFLVDGWWLRAVSVAVVIVVAVLRGGLKCYTHSRGNCC